MAYAYPLKYPEGWKRNTAPRGSAFKRSGREAMQFLEGELGRMLGVTHVVISTNVPLSAEGKMRLDREPIDGGVAVYFQRHGKATVIACDEFDFVRDNMTAIAKTIEAFRGIERWGASDMLERAFSGFTALSAGKGWREVLAFDPNHNPTESQVKLQFSYLAKKRHPDVGGSTEAFQELVQARDQALAEVGTH